MLKSLNTIQKANVLRQLCWCSRKLGQAIVRVQKVRRYGVSPYISHILCISFMVSGI